LYAGICKTIKKKPTKPPKTVKRIKAISKVGMVEEATIALEISLIEAITKGNILGSDINLAKRKEMIFAKGFETDRICF